MRATIMVEEKLQRSNPQRRNIKDRNFNDWREERYWVKKNVNVQIYNVVVLKTEPSIFEESNVKGWKRKTSMFIIL